MTQKVEMTVTRALVELKRLDKEILNETNKAEVYLAVGSQKKVPNLSFEDAQRQMQSNYDTVLALVANRSKIQDAIHISNAITRVKVGGEEMTVLQAINLKTTAVYHKNLLDRLIARRTQAITKKAAQDTALEGKIDTALIALVGKDAKADSAQIELVRKSQEDLYKVEVVDLEELDSRINKLQKMVDNVTNELDFILSESNALTKITV